MGRKKKESSEEVSTMENSDTPPGAYITHYFQALLDGFTRLRKTLEKQRKKQMEVKDLMSEIEFKRPYSFDVRSYGIAVHTSCSICEMDVRLGGFEEDHLSDALRSECDQEWTDEMITKECVRQNAPHKECAQAHNLV